ncbi:MAG: aromatic amino acid transport family protein, partial [bacterium]
MRINNGFSEKKKLIYAIAMLAGTIIGVGFFSLPYILTQMGILVFLGYFLILGGLVLFIHLLFGEVALATPDFMRLPGYAKIYLGEKGKIVSLAAAIIGAYGVILAYTIIGGGFLETLLLPLFGGSRLIYSLGYFAIGSLFIYLGVKSIARICLAEIVVFFL